MKRLYYLTLLITITLTINVKAQDLDGTCWDNFSCDGTFGMTTCFEDGIMTHSTDGLNFMTSYGVDSISGNLWFVDISGSCGPDTGWYSYEIIDGMMTFTSIDDPCAPRESNLTCWIFLEQEVVIYEDVLDGTCWDNQSCDGAFWFITCFENGIMTHTTDGLNFMTSYGVDSISGNLWFVDISGSCGPDTGWYSFEIIDGTMTFTSIDDPCAPREANLTCFVFMEQEVEIYEDVLDGTCWDNQSCDGAFWFITCFEDGIMTSSIDSLGLNFMTNYGVDSISGNLWFVDISGNCGPDTGWYSYEIIDDTMTFTVIDDPCAAREANLGCLEFISPSVGISEIESISEVLLYPNPTSGHINLAFENSMEVAIKVYTLDGKIIYHQENINGPTYEFDLEGKAGIYILEISNQKDRRQYKIVKN